MVDMDADQRLQIGDAKSDVSSSTLCLRMHSTRRKVMMSTRKVQMLLTPILIVGRSSSHVRSFLQII